MYAMYMALHITNELVEQAVRRLAGMTGESMTDAIGTAALERIARLAPSPAGTPMPSVEEVLAMVRSYHLNPINDDLTDDEIFGYGSDGVPE